MLLEARRVRFEYLGEDVALDFLPADDKANRIYAALAAVYLAPFKLSIDLGRISEERATALLAKVYAQSVVMGSPSPSLAAFKASDWERWLVANPYEFAWLRTLATDPETFKKGPQVIEVADPDEAPPPPAGEGAGV